MSHKPTTPCLLGMDATPYKTDFYLWLQNQILLLKNGEFVNLDVRHLIEELDSLGISEKKALRSHLCNLILHLLKVKYQPAKHTKSWDRSILNARVEIKWLLKESPSLKNELQAIFCDAYEAARLKAALETKLSVSIFPCRPPWTLTAILSLEENESG